MKKNNKNFNNRGFVMSELLAGSIVILLLFSILFANYLPLSGEFESRMAYNNVTANYGAFYVRKAYKTILENSSAKATLDSALTTKGYYKVYNSKDPYTINLATGDLKTTISNIIEEYQIEEIIITKYKTDEVKGKVNFNNRYKRSDGVLYKYIKYLPYYTMSEFDGKTYEPYRLIMKTSYGYATTQILPDPPTPISCFDLKTIRDGEFAITDYNEDCGPNVVITANEITVGTGSSAKRGYITSIAGDESSSEKGAFEGKGIKTIKLSSKVTSIGARAFKNNSISKFNFKDNAPSVTIIGEEAFSNNNFTRIVIPETLEQIGSGAFSNNYKLQAIEFDFKDSSFDTIPSNMFALDSRGITNQENMISLFIPSSIKSIGANAFHNLQFSSIEFENNIETSNNGGTSNPSNLKTIGEGAFGIDDDVRISSSNYIRLSLPHRIQTIGNAAFKNVKLGKLVFQVNDSGESALETIGNYAFSVYETDINNIQNKEQFCDNGATSCEYKREIKIPIKIESIGNYAFKNQKLSSIEFNATGSNNETIYSEISHIGDQAFVGNNLSSISMPPSLADADSTGGAKIFGDSYTLGDNIGEITTQTNRFTKDWWCNTLFGESCTEEQVGDEGNNYSYTVGNKTKYVTTYIDVEE